MTPEQEQQLLNYLRGGVPQSVAAEAVGLRPQAISVKKLRNYKHNRPFLRLLAQARAQGAILLLKKIRESPDWRARAWQLERSYPEQFASVESRVKIAMPKGSGSSSDARDEALLLAMAATLGLVVAAPQSVPEKPTEGETK
ncbi:MAG: hypothetical protein WAT39_01955 [Planctomycetota bacterium]